MTRKMYQLLHDAHKAGWTIDDSSAGRIEIFKTDKRGKMTAGIVIWPKDRTAYRLDVDPGIALTIRTIKGMREQLGL